MTGKKDFKQPVRQRMQATGESYTTARMRILDQRSDDTESGRGGRVGESVDVSSLSAIPAMDETYFVPVEEFGVESVRYHRASGDEVEAIYFFVPENFVQQWALIQRLRERWSDEQHELVVLRRTATANRVLWSRDCEARESASEKEYYGVRLIHETSGRWAARSRDGSVEYGLSAADAQAKLLKSIALVEGDWRNAVDDDNAAYIENQDDTD